MPNMEQFLKVSEAAALIGVSASTIRNWDRSGKVRAMRNAINNYRLYDRDEIKALIDNIVSNSVIKEKNDK